MNNILNESSVAATEKTLRILFLITEKYACETGVCNKLE